MPDRNIDLLTKVRDQISGHPDQYDQTTWAYIDGRYCETPEWALARALDRDEFACVSTACVAGWTVLLAGEAPRPYDWRGTASQLLGLHPVEGEWLFHEDRTREEVLLGLELLIRGGNLLTLVEV